MVPMYLFGVSFLGICILFLFKIWELKRGSKPFSLLRYRLDLFFRRYAEKLKHYSGFVNRKTVRLGFAYGVGGISAAVSLVLTRFRSSKIYLSIKGQILPKERGSTVSAFLRDVEEFKKAAVGEKRGEESGEKKEEGLHKETENSKTV